MNIEIEIELISLCIAKDGNAQKKLYGITLPYLNVICKRYLFNEADVKDVLQDSFINIFKNIHQFDVQRASFKTWMTKIAINNCLKYNHKRNKTQTEELSNESHTAKVDPKILSELSNMDLLLWLKKMPHAYFQVFNMFVIDGFSHQEIATFLNIDASLSRKRLSRARDWIKKRSKTEIGREFSFSFN